jgi:hypothetical protein
MAVLDLQDSEQQQASGARDPPTMLPCTRDTATFEADRSRAEGADEQSHANHDAQAQEPPHPSNSYVEEDWEVVDARPILPKAAFFMGDLRDGLSMVSINHPTFYCYSCHILAAMLNCFMICRTARNVEFVSLSRFTLHASAHFLSFVCTHDS